MEENAARRDTHDMYWVLLSGFVSYRRDLPSREPRVFSTQDQQRQTSDFSPSPSQAE